MNLAHKRVGALNRMAVDLENHVAGSKARIVRWARRTDALNRRAVHMLREVQLLTKIGCQVRNRQAKPSTLCRRRT